RQPYSRGDSDVYPADERCEWNVRWRREYGDDQLGGCGHISSLHRQWHSWKLRSNWESGDGCYRPWFPTDEPVGEKGSASVMFRKVATLGDHRWTIRFHPWFAGGVHVPTHCSWHFFKTAGA